MHHIPCALSPDYLKTNRRQPPTVGSEGETEMSSLIQQDTVWTESLRIPSSSVVVFPNTTLTIQGSPNSPIRIEFEGDAAINLQSFARVVVSDAVFVGDTSMDGVTRAGKGIQYLTAQATSVSIDGLSCINMEECLHVKADKQTVNVTNSSFQNCKTAVSKSTDVKVDFNFDGCRFQENSIGF